MNGIEMGNILAGTALMRQKDSRTKQAETKNASADPAAQEEMGKNGKTDRQTSERDNGVRWVQNGSGKEAAANRSGNKDAASSWTRMGSNNAAGGAGSTYAMMRRSLWNGAGENNKVQQPGTNMAGNTAPDAGAAENKQADKAAINGQNGTLKADQNGSNTQKETLLSGQNSPNAQKGILSSGQTNQFGIGTNRVGQTNNFSQINRQRLAQQKKAKAAAKKKNLNYNRREVSTQVLRANKIGSAARALATARTKVSSLRRCIGTGQYDENELRIAISHAESIVKTAKKKVANLKEEQIKERRVAREKQTNALKKQVKKQRIREKRQQVKRELTAQRKQAERQTKMKELRCKQLKRRHRGEELSDVLEADIKYIKDMGRYRRYGTAAGSRNGADTTGTAALEIGDSAMRLNDLERTEQALKYEEQQMNQEAASFSGSSASGSVDIAVGDAASGAGSGGADLGSAAVDMAAVGGAVDISL